MKEVICMHKNKTIISGKVVQIEESHKLDNNVFYRYTVEVPRMSGAADYLPCIISDKLLFNNPIEVGDLCEMDGEIRTINKMISNKGKLIVFNYVHDIQKVTLESFKQIKDKNIVYIEGYNVRKTNYRETASGRKIADMIIAHNRSYKKESYIPSIAWGLDATLASKLEVGREIFINGRFQSRPYVTKENEEKIAYEVSIHSLGVPMQD